MTARSCDRISVASWFDWPWSLVILFLLISMDHPLVATESPMPSRSTTVSIVGDQFFINGQPTYRGRFFRGMKIEGLLMNSRMVQGIFDDENPQTRGRWNYPDGPWDADRNTREFMAAMPVWRDHGLLAFTLGMQGGSPEGYSKSQPWNNSAFDAQGGLKPAYMNRLEKILDKADQLGMVVILSFFYFGQDERIKDEAALIAAVKNAVHWLADKGYTHLLIEIANEVNVKAYEHEIICPPRVHELIELVKSESQGKFRNPARRLLVGTSMAGGGIPPANIIQSSDVILLHGNGQNSTDGIRHMVDVVRSKPEYRGQPIVFNEDDHFDFDQPDNHMIAAVRQYASWGYFDYRMKGETAYEEGYQSMPADWGIHSARKRGFFQLLRDMTQDG